MNGTASWPSDCNHSAIAGGRFISRRNRISRSLRGHDLLTRQPSGISQGLADIFLLQVGVIAEDVVPGNAFGDQRDDQPDGDPEPSDAGATAHFAWLESNSVEGRVAPSRFFSHRLASRFVLHAQHTTFCFILVITHYPPFALRGNRQAGGDVVARCSLIPEARYESTSPT